MIYFHYKTYGNIILINYKNVQNILIFTIGNDKSCIVHLCNVIDHLPKTVIQSRWFIIVLSVFSHSHINITHPMCFV